MYFKHFFTELLVLVLLKYFTQHRIHIDRTVINTIIYFLTNYYKIPYVNHIWTYRLASMN